ncbi:MAG: hypothetical protein GF308_03325 [Candidatus Heimdallarchaeota archaeon]|nr:hypothetical protein [Candidatus Heimdallarchaeota archaeon]
MPENNSILEKKYHWSSYAFLIDVISFSSLIGLICTLMIMHKVTDVNIDFPNWVVIVVGIVLFAFLFVISYFDSRRANPKERLFGARIFNLPVFTIMTFIAIAIFWGKPVQNAVIYGALSGGFAGYLAGGLAFANFFIHIKNTIYRIIFGGWIGTFLGTILGALFGGLIDPINGQVFGGLFFGFWGGVISGAIATILLWLFREKKKFTGFFTKILFFDIQKEITRDLQKYFQIGKEKELPSSKKELDLKQWAIYQPKEEKEYPKIIEILLFVIYLISPWENEEDIDRIQTFDQLINNSIKKLDLQRKEDIIIKASS